MRSPFMLNADWFEPAIKQYVVPNLVADAAKDFGMTDDRVRLAIAEVNASLAEGIVGMRVVQAFRRESSMYESARLPLRGLDAQATYEVTDLDVNTPQRISGRELMDKGLLVSLANSPAAAVVVYKKLLN